MYVVAEQNNLDFDFDFGVVPNLDEESDPITRLYVKKLIFFTFSVSPFFFKDAISKFP